jgi:FAD/FMN-containing dehydrogenase
MATAAPTAELIARLQDGLKGRLILPSDADYDAARTVVAGGIDRHPAAIARVAGTEDVQHVVRVARDTGAEIAVRSGGHSSVGHGVTEGGVVIDLRDMKALEIDPDERVAVAETGLTAAEVTTAAAEHGLAIGFGDTGSVGIGGITLGGGVGYLVRKYGLTIDNLLGAEIVTADGERLDVDADRHPDLFWAIRGGGGNFGVATRFRYRLSPLDGFVGGMIFLPATAETIAGFVAASEAAPEELSTIANIMTAPPMPFLPEDVVGKVILMGMIAHVGDVEAGQRAMEPFRSLATPLADMLRPMTYPEMYPSAEGGEDYHPLAVAMNMHIDRVDEAVAATILEHLNASDAPLRAAQLRVLGGAMARVPSDATAYANRSSRIMVNLAAFYEGEADRADKQAWLDRFAVAIDQGDPAVYVNFLGDEGDRIRAAYPGGTWDRLVEVKRRYDPDNLFRLNQNVPPAAAPAG